MTDLVEGTRSPAAANPRAVLGDAETLQRAIRKAVATSPRAFLKTPDDIDAKSIFYWEQEILRSTWAVVEQGTEVLGIAAAKQPDRDKDFNIDDFDRARFIESVWIDDSIRRRGIGMRLVQFLIDVECDQRGIEQFFLWVFNENEPAIRLYEDHFGFKPTEAKNWQPQVKMTEIQYRLLLDSPVQLAAKLRVNADARENDFRELGIHYRVLGGGQGL
jgi:ribosomal protein S18 acetylase RimI-like enzyme